MARRQQPLRGSPRERDRGAGAPGVLRPGVPATSVPYARLRCNGLSHRTHTFRCTKEPFRVPFCAILGQKPAKKGAPRDPKHYTKQSRSPSTPTCSGPGGSRVVGRAVFPACGDDQSGLATGAASRPRPVPALYGGGGGDGSADGLDPSPRARLQAAPPADADAPVGEPRQPGVLGGGPAQGARAL